MAQITDNKFFSSDPVQTEAPTETAPEVPTIKVGEKEFSQDELNRLVSLGEKASEIEKNHGSFDKYVSEYGRRSKEIGEYKSKLEEMETQMASMKQATSAADLSPEQVEIAKKQLNNLLGGEPITQGNFAKMYVAMREGEKLLEECDGLAGEIDGKDGRPAFNRDEIINYMSETGIKKPLAAYKDKYEKELEGWQTNQLSAKPKGMDTLQPSGEKAPKEVKANRDNLSQLIAEAMYGPQSE